MKSTNRKCVLHFSLLLIHTAVVGYNLVPVRNARIHATSSILICPAFSLWVCVIIVFNYVFTHCLSLDSYSVYRMDVVWWMNESCTDNETVVSTVFAVTSWRNWKSCSEGNRYMKKKNYDLPMEAILEDWRILFSWLLTLKLFKPLFLCFPKALFIKMAVIASHWHDRCLDCQTPAQ